MKYLGVSCMVAKSQYQCFLALTQLFEEWKMKVEARQHVVQGRVFQIVSQRTRTGTILRLQVNFAPETITLAKEVG